MEGSLIAAIVINAIIILIALYLFIIYIKCKNLHSYSCYNIIFLNCMIAIDNVLRIIPFENTPYRFIQAFLLVYIDKVLLAIITTQVIIINLGFTKIKFYSEYQKKIFLSFLFINLIINLAISTFYISNGKKDYYMYSYCADNIPKKIIDTIFNSILFVTNIYFIIDLLFYLSKNKNEDKNVEIKNKYEFYFYKSLFMLFINSFTFTVSYLIVYGVLNFNVDLLYLITCFIIDLFYTINKRLYKETLNICCMRDSSNGRLLSSSSIESEEDNNNNDNNNDDNDDLYY